MIGNRLIGVLDRMLGSLFSFSHNFMIKDIDGKENFILHKKMGFIWERYDVISNGDVIASISQEKTLGIPKTFISTKDSNYIVSTDLFGKDFSIKNGETIVAEINKKFLSLRDTYQLCIYEEGKDEIFIAATIAIDNSFYE